MERRGETEQRRRRSGPGSRARSTDRPFRGRRARGLLPPPAPNRRHVAGHAPVRRRRSLPTDRLVHHAQPRPRSGRAPPCPTSAHRPEMEVGLRPPGEPDPRPNGEVLDGGLLRPLHPRPSPSRGCSTVHLAEPCCRRALPQRRSVAVVVGPSTPRGSAGGVTRAPLRGCAPDADQNPCGAIRATREPVGAPVSGRTDGRSAHPEDGRRRTAVSTAIDLAWGQRPAARSCRLLGNPRQGCALSLGARTFWSAAAEGGQTNAPAEGRLPTPKPRLAVTTQPLQNRSSLPAQPFSGCADLLVRCRRRRPDKRAGRRTAPQPPLPPPPKPRRYA